MKEKRNTHPRKNTKALITASILILTFAIWTLLVQVIDVRSIGPNGSKVGFSALNAAIHRVIGVNMTLYTVTDWLGLVPIGFCLGFALLGLVQLTRRRSILKVDGELLLLGGFYIAVMAVYVLFELVTVNCRPVLINGYLETSYPSSTTLLTLCVMPTAAIMLNRYIKKASIRYTLTLLIRGFTAFMVIGRVVSGVHWISDIIGGVLLSGGLVLMLCYFLKKYDETHHR